MSRNDPRQDRLRTVLRWAACTGRVAAAAVALGVALIGPVAAQSVGSVTDPTGDTFTFFPPDFVDPTVPTPDPPVPTDVTALSGAGCAYGTVPSLTIVVNFAADISPPFLLPGFIPVDNSVGGAIDLDVDQDVMTGAPSFIPGAVGLGVDYKVFFSDPFTYDPVAGTALLARVVLPYDPFAPPEPVGTVPITFAQNSLTISIPLALLAEGDGAVNLAAWVWPPAAPFSLNDVTPDGAVYLTSALCPPPPPPPPPDSDGDGIPNAADNCPFDYDPDQDDADGDALPASIVLSLDVSSPIWTLRCGDACDNCMEVFNPAQSDGNDDGVGDMCDQGTPTPFVLKSVRLKSNNATNGGPNGTLVVRGTFDTTELGGVDGLRAALRHGFVVHLDGAGLNQPTGLTGPTGTGESIVFPPCPSVSLCVGTEGESAGFLRKGATNLFDVKIKAWGRTFAPPLTSSQVRVTLSLGQIDRADTATRCRTSGRRVRTACRKK